MDYERERRRQKRYREAMRNRIIAAVLLAGIIVGAIFIIKGCKKDDAPADDAQNTNQPVDNVGDTTTPDNVIVDDELLTLVNPLNPLPDDWTVDLVTLDDGHRVDSRCYEAYMEMINACKAAGYSPVNCSSYRTQETQQSLYDNKVQRLISSGMSEDEAKIEAAKAVAIPGTSEHQLGLAVDLVDANMQDLTSAQESTTAMWARTRHRRSSTGISHWRSIWARRSIDGYKGRGRPAPPFIRRHEEVICSFSRSWRSWYWCFPCCRWCWCSWCFWCSSCYP